MSKNDDPVDNFSMYKSDKNPKIFYNYYNEKEKVKVIDQSVESLEKSINSDAMNQSKNRYDNENLMLNRNSYYYPVNSSLVQKEEDKFYKPVNGLAGYELYPYQNSLNPIQYQQPLINNNQHFVAHRNERYPNFQYNTWQASPYTEGFTQFQQNPYYSNNQTFVNSSIDQYDNSKSLNILSKDDNKSTFTSKRNRMTYSKVQLDTLEDEFSLNHFIHRQRRSELSGVLELTEKQIKIWFQNRRMKEKKDNSKRKSSEITKDTTQDDTGDTSKEKVQLESPT